MSYLDYQTAQVPTGFRKILYINWPLVLLITAVSCIGFLMLYSVAGGDLDSWARPQMERFVVGLIAMIGLAFVPTSLVMMVCSLKLSDRLGTWTTSAAR